MVNKRTWRKNEKNETIFMPPLFKLSGWPCTSNTQEAWILYCEPKCLLSINFQLVPWLRPNKQSWSLSICRRVGFQAHHPLWCHMKTCRLSAVMMGINKAKQKPVTLCNNSNKCMLGIVMLWGKVQKTKRRTTRHGLVMFMHFADAFIQSNLKGMT